MMRKSFYQINDPCTIWGYIIQNPNQQTSGEDVKRTLRRRIKSESKIENHCLLDLEKLGKTLMDDLWTSIKLLSNGFFTKRDRRGSDPKKCIFSRMARKRHFWKKSICTSSKAWKNIMDLWCRKLRKEIYPRKNCKMKSSWMYLGFFLGMYLHWYISNAMERLPIKGKSNLRAVKFFWTTSVSTAIFLKC